MSLAVSSRRLPRRLMFWLAAAFAAGLGAGMLVGCSGGHPPTAPLGVVAVSLSPSDWEVSEAAGYPPHPLPSTHGGEWDLPILPAPASLCYVTTRVWARAEEGQVLTASFSLSGSGVVAPATTPDAPDHGEATVSAILIGAQGARLWGGKQPLLTAGSISVPLRADAWGNVDGHSLSSSDFSRVLGQLGYIGLTFSGQSFAGHCVASTGGPVTFTLTSMSVT